MADDIVAEAEQLAQLAWAFLDAGYYKCAYWGCQCWVQPQYLYCKRHALEVGLLGDRRLCRAVTASGRQCSRTATTPSGFCWQHRSLQYKPPWEP
jgi:hypothetical protein